MIGKATSTAPGPSTRTLLLIFGSVTAIALVAASFALIVRATSSRNAIEPLVPSAGAVAADDARSAPAANAGRASLGAKRFTLRLGQGFRFKDGAVVVANEHERPDVVFKYVAPHVGGLATRYNPVSQQVETGLEPTLTAPMPLLLATHINAFEQKPDVARTTSGDAAAYVNQAPITTTTRYVLLMNQAGDQYLLALDELEAPNGKYDDWRIGFTYEQVHLPLGLAGGKINQPLPGKLIFRDWYRTKMVVRVDLTTGKEDALVDGILPSAAGDALLGYGDSTSAYVVRDRNGRTLHTIRFNEQVLGPVLSPDGTRLAASVYRPGPQEQFGDVMLPGAPVLATAVFDLQGREIAVVPGYDDAAWTPDGKLIATGALYGAGLFEIDPSTKNVRPIHAQIGSPFQPAVSPDGKTIAFVTGERVWLIGRDGQNLRQLYPDGHQQQRPVFSPDGTKIAAVICNTMAYDMTGEVFVIDVKTLEITPLRSSTGATLVPDTNTRLNWVP